MADDSTNSPDPASHRPFPEDDAETDGDLGNDDMSFEPEDDEESDGVDFYEVDEDDDEVDDEELMAQLADGLEDDDVEFHDAEDGAEQQAEGGYQIELSIDPGDEEGQVGAIRMLRADGGAINLSQAQLLRIIGHNRIGSLIRQHARSATFHDDDDDNDDDEDASSSFASQRRNRARSRPVDLPPVPNPKGRELMDSGTFGASIPYKERLQRRKKKVARRVLARELAMDDRDAKRENRLLSHELIPETAADTIIHYDTRCYSGQFSDDGNFFFTCSQDFWVRMYDTSNPYDWKYYKKVYYPFGQWTITDASLSRDNNWLAFSSIRSVVSLASTDPSSSAEPQHLDFADLTGSGRAGRFRMGYRNFGIWSIRFSGDGREIVAGTSDHSVYVYDIDAQRSILRIPGHSEDVNAVCFGDTSSPHILYSGSDDCLIKVWDRRSMGDSREAGAFLGHTEGLTYVDSKGDGRYVLSNGKDQSMKLWDLRSMTPPEKANSIDPCKYSTGYDYRFMNFTDDDYSAHPDDTSVVTFRGHSVLKTLIRCHFSPPGSSDSRYVYTGSEDGSVYIYNMDATLERKIDVASVTHRSRRRDPSLYNASIHMEDNHSRGAWKTCVRDASWHPAAPIIAATSWNGWGMSTGTCTVHSYNDGIADDDSGLGTGRRVNAMLAEEDYGTGRTTLARGLMSRLVGRGNFDDDEEAW